ncbi:hypothetical protein YC2023_015042 [Brassica napus]
MGYLWDGRRIVVKKVTKKMFLTVLAIISHVSHPNTALLVDCCVERGLYLIFRFSTFTPRCKVLEFLTNGNEAEIAKSWRMPKDMTNDGEDNDAWDDYSMFFGYDTTGTVHFTAQNDDVSVSLKKTEKYRKNQMKLEKITKTDFSWVEFVITENSMREKSDSMDINGEICNKISNSNNKI